MDFIEESIVDDEQYYILLDEVQLLEEFEEVLNSLLHINNVDIYVTGNNSKFLSKDVITDETRDEDVIEAFVNKVKDTCRGGGNTWYNWIECVIINIGFIIVRIGRKYTEELQ